LDEHVDGEMMETTETRTLNSQIAQASGLCERCLPSRQ